MWTPYEERGATRAGRMTELLIIGGVLGVGMLLVIHGPIFKTRRGINTATQIECPRCHKLHGQIRTPQNLRQTLWGGFTCAHCGFEVDKRNRPISR
jgi:hypothetical protein